MRALFYAFSLNALLQFTAVSSNLLAETGVVGWPLPELTLDQPPGWLGDDPVLGRLICPAVSQHHLQNRQSEGIIFKEVEEQPAFKDKGVIWRYHLRSGLYWWSGKPVTGEDFSTFIKTNLEKTLAARTAGAVSPPPFEVQMLADGVVELIWYEAPRFGPYLFNGIPFWKESPDSKSGFTYQCAGIYQPIMAQGGLLLSPSPAYKIAKEPLFFAQGPVNRSWREKYEFKLAERFPPTFTDQAACGTAIELPWVTAVAWNPKLAPTNDGRMRRLFTQLMPRGSLLRQGAGHLGQLASSVIPRTHPGYNKGNLIRPFLLSETARGFEALGYKRDVSHEIRNNPQGEPFSLKIKALGSGPNLVKKVLKDSFWAVGIKVDFLENDDPNTHGLLSSFMFSWAELDLLSLFHSKAKPGLGWSLENAKLDDMLLGYALSLTTKAPELEWVPKIHDVLYNEEPMSILMHHRACFVTPKKVAVKHVDNPEWFKDLVVASG